MTIGACFGYNRESKEAPEERVVRRKTMKIYTRTGDLGQTSLWGRAAEKRVAKNSSRVKAYGAVDEANAVIGVARAHLQHGSQLDAVLEQIQHRLFAIGADLSNISPDRENRITDSDVTYLETQIDAWDADLTPLRHFILPAGSLAVVHLHQARTVIRRAERDSVALLETDPGLVPIVRYLNRLSDLLFIAARYVNHLDGTPDCTAKF